MEALRVKKLILLGGATFILLKSMLFFLFFSSLNFKKLKNLGNIDFNVK